ncbi:hypothetical protein [Clostridium perfringens]|jgi:hypothetical protein|uniref:hypothetical protein n=2 Tax=Clostridium perfringens TaxID=1502 RepID=UPI0008A6A18C|nr:hypothetical protein [Clostridium perfringens]AOY53479.1 Not available [Clostridium perfringens]EHR1328714.1 hypothetical protein [Clostridium perfringens]EHR1331847.1 hypothetical protein [Clostridium perfringens]EHR1425324.1 hypothetical protein [Clostridium perfringens]EHR9038260.1 hypothetical protein [Clostridium perfringens]
MNKLISIKEICKILIIYFITTIVAMIVAGVIVEHEFYNELKNYLWVLIIFTLLFLFLIKLFRVKFKSVLIFLGIIMFLLLFILLNLEFFVSIASEPNEDIFPTMFWLALYTTLPFQSVINLLVGYNIESLSYLILPTYMVTLSLLSYKVLKFKPQKNKQDK